VIPTGYKHEIPKTHSYPLGAKAISDELAGVPQFESLKINFSFGWKGFAKDRVPGAPYIVLEVGYSGPGNSSLSGWTIHVRPVPRTLKHEIQTKLLAEALPKLKAWLQANAHSSDREGGHHLTFLFDELAGELVTEEYSSAEWNTERI
jgi:hypothetical protein